MNNEYLSNQELSRLTGASENSSKSRWLNGRSIPFKVDGKRIIVSREHVRNWLEGKVTLTRTGMNMSAIR
ncbi:DUF4224 domain-containing protein [Comamonas testosteroni]|uniref:DUF4224 domain-containing protein n=1 Tax=Comamonas testosteroni TaxID=285 RepID=A0A373FPQ9_COMTE|nr:DUF4224 domain-containing protein [Comamonas testosteroni]RGE46154.1 DUF4224 domain-containing protein [Comamonas testosteroni]